MAYRIARRPDGAVEIRGPVMPEEIGGLVQRLRRLAPLPLGHVPPQDELRRLYCEEGLWPKAIAHRYGVTPEAVTAALRRAGIAPRSRRPRSAANSAIARRVRLARRRAPAAEAA